MQSINDPASARDALRGTKPEADTNSFWIVGSITVLAVLAAMAVVAFNWSW